MNLRFELLSRSALFVSLLFSPAAHAASICSNLILETPEGAPLLRKYEQELQKALIPQLKKNGWNPKTGMISVQNMPNALYRIAPHYMIRFDLNPESARSPKVVLRNKTIQTALKLDSYPVPERKACELVLQARDDEYLVSQTPPDEYRVNSPAVPTKIYVPRIVIRYLVPLQEAGEATPAPLPRATVSSGTIDSVITNRGAPTLPAAVAHAPLPPVTGFRGDRIK